MRLWNHKPALVAGACALTLAGSPAFAATPTQGSLGGTSTGQIGITATIPASVQITKLGDLAFGTLDPTTASQLTENPCVWSNTATKGYSITATGSGASSAFTLSNGTSTVAYGVQWAGTTGATTGTTLTAGSAATGFTSTATSPTCASGAATTASLIVGFTTAQMQAAVGSATAYTGTLTLVVSPQ
ncbi:MAG TPA: hypothetical protein VIK68_07680 [Sphingomicrobium sp.]